MSTITASALSGRKIPAPGSNLAVANLKGNKTDRLAEKTIELTTCAQFGDLLRRRMVWFGLTQKQEREHAYPRHPSLLIVRQHHLGTVFDWIDNRVLRNIIQDTGLHKTIEKPPLSPEVGQHLRSQPVPR